MTTTPLTDQQAADREEILTALSTAGAFCGDCGFEPGETGCSDCVRVREQYADALTPITDRLRAELATARAQTDAARDWAAELTSRGGVLAQIAGGLLIRISAAGES